VALIRLFLGVFLLMVGFAAAAQPAPYAAPRASLAPGEHQAVINDARLWYRVAGRRTGTPVLFLHGGPGQGSQSFARFVGPHLERSHRMVYLDQRGAGRSERPWNDSYSIELMVDDIEKLRRAWNVPRIALVGHSFGTVLAMEYAARYPGRVDKIVMAGGVNDIQKAFDIQCARLQRTDAAAYERAVAAKPADWTARCNIMAAYPGAEGQRVFARNIFPDPATEQILKEADEANGLRNTGVVGAALFRQGLLTYRFTRAAALQMPVLIIGGTRDFQSVIELHRDFVRTLPNGRLLEYEGAGHFMWVEQPERFARDVSTFLSTGR
jgi:proline iminopeptidase